MHSFDAHDRSSGFSRDTFKFAAEAAPTTTSIMLSTFDEPK
jgi:hypothetical protein